MYLYMHLYTFICFYVRIFCADNAFQEFVNSPCMLEIKERSCFIHVDVPGHGDNDSALPDRSVASTLITSALDDCCKMHHSENHSLTIKIFIHHSNHSLPR